MSLRIKVNPTAIPFGMVALALAFLYTMLSPGLPLSEDYAIYLQQAFNIAHGISMGNMGIVEQFDPALPLFTQLPLTYPPLLPALYAVPVEIFGFDIETFKLLQLALLGCGLALFVHAMLRWRFSVLEVSMSVLLFALTYQVRYSVNVIESDFPFIAFLMLALMAIDRFSRAVKQHLVLWSVLSGTAIFLAVDMRTIAIALVPTLLCVDVIVHRRIRVAVAIPLTACLVLWMLQRTTLGEGEAYGFITNYRFFTPAKNAFQFAFSASIPWMRSGFAVKEPVYVLLCGLAAFGVSVEALRGNVAAVFIVLNSALLLILPDFEASTRYLIPHFLVFGAFACRGAAIVARRFPWCSGERTLSSGAAAAAAGLFFFVPTPPVPSDSSYVIGSPPVNEVFAFSRAHLPQDALVAVRRDRSFHLFTGRRTIRIPYLEQAALLDWLDKNHVDYLVLKYSPSIKTPYDFEDCPETPLCTTDSLLLKATEVFRNSQFEIFRIDRQ